MAATKKSPTVEQVASLPRNLGSTFAVTVAAVGITGILGYYAIKKSISDAVANLVPHPFRTASPPATPQETSTTHGS